MAYMEDIQQNAILTDEQERELANRIKDGDRKAVDELVKHNLRFVLYLASQYTGQGVDYDDLVSEGNIGLLKAANRFSPYPGKRFVKFAAPIVRDVMEKYIQQHSGLYKIPTKENNAAEKKRSQPLSVDAPITAGSNNNFSLLNLLENTDAPFADQAFVKNDMNEYLFSLVLHPGTGAAQRTPTDPESVKPARGEAFSQKVLKGIFHFPFRITNRSKSRSRAGRSVSTRITETEAPRASREPMLEM